MNVKNIPLDKITQDENSRVIYKQSDVNELMSSMKKRGLLQPIGVRPMPHGRFEAVYGNRRILAAKKLDWAEIPAVVLENVDTDTERDLTNLSENIKRQNTSVSEEGRVYMAMVDRGLSVPEIAARLEVSTTRVQTGIDVFKYVPASMKAQVVHRTIGRTAGVGQIPASSAHTIMTLRRKEKLNRKQTRALLNYAATPEATTQHISQLAPLVKMGATIPQAIQLAKQLERVAIHVYVDVRRREKLEKKYGTSINDLILQQIEKNTELQVKRELSGPHFTATQFRRKAKKTG